MELCLDLGAGTGSDSDDDEVPDRNSGTTQWTRNIFEGQALGLLVPVGSVYYYLRPPAYQPSRLLGALPGYPVGNLILKRASRLDAFSGYHFRT